MSTTFYVGERPSTPLVITVTDEAGAPRDLSGYSEVSIVPVDTVGLPPGDCSVSDAEAGKVQYDFIDPFEVAALLVLQVKMETGTGDVDMSGSFTLTVLDQVDSTTTLVTPAQVEAWTGRSVSQQQVVQAQFQVSLAVGADLSDEDWLAGLGSQDTYWLSLAVAYQAADLARFQAATEQIQVPYLPGVQSVSTGDQSITFRAGESGVSVPGMSSQANIALRRISWMKPVRTIHAKPFLRGYSPEEAAAVVVGGFGYRP